MWTSTTPYAGLQRNCGLSITSSHLALLPSENICCEIIVLDAFIYELIIKRKLSLDAISQLNGHQIRTCIFRCVKPGLGISIFFNGIEAEIETEALEMPNLPSKMLYWGKCVWRNLLDLEIHSA